MVTKIKDKKVGLPMEFYEEIFNALDKWKKVVDNYRDVDDSRVKFEVKGLDSTYDAFHYFYEDVCDTYDEEYHYVK